MKYGFRLRFDLGGDTTINSPANRAVLFEDESECVWLQLDSRDEPLHQVTSLVIFGRDYESESDAMCAGGRWSAVLQRAFVSLRLAADFGARAVASDFGGVPREFLERKRGDGLILTAGPGLSVFENEPWPQFGAVTASGSVGLPAEPLLRAVEATVRLNVPMTAREQVSYELFSSSSFVESSDARLIMLVMAIEALIEPEARDPCVVAHVEELISRTQAAALAGSEVQSLLGSLRHLRTESISQAGRRTVKVLAPRLYGGLEPDKFFTKCYALRGRLVHGTHPRPTQNEVDAPIGPLREMVSDLLSGPLRN